MSNRQQICGEYSIPKPTSIPVWNSSTPQPCTATLLKLPLEIRLIIYDFCLVGASFSVRAAPVPMRKLIDSIQQSAQTDYESIDPLLPEDDQKEFRAHLGTAGCGRVLPLYLQYVCKQLRAEIFARVKTRAANVTLRLSCRMRMLQTGRLPGSLLSYLPCWMIKNVREVSIKYPRFPGSTRLHRSILKIMPNLMRIIIHTEKRPLLVLLGWRVLDEILLEHDPGWLRIVVGPLQRLTFRLDAMKRKWSPSNPWLCRNPAELEWIAQNIGGLKVPAKTITKLQEACGRDVQVLVRSTFGMLKALMPDQNKEICGPALITELKYTDRGCEEEVRYSPAWDHIYDCIDRGVRTEWIGIDEKFCRFDYPHYRNESLSIPINEVA